MQLRVDVNNLKSDTLIEILKSFKKTNMIEDFKVVEKTKSYDDIVLKDIKKIKKAIKSANSGLGIDTLKKINIKDI